MKQSIFDKIILDNLIAEQGKKSFGYSNAKGKIYDNYYTEKEFLVFLKDMKKNDLDIYKKFKDGKGSELYPRRGGLIPPKMASVASSSRFCYLALHKGASHLNIDLPLDVEHECPIIGKRGTQPQLDVFAENSNTYIEVKCHEIFQMKKETKLGSFYGKYIYGKKDNVGFDFAIEQKPVEEFEIPFERFGIKSFPIHFDLKQFICHLLGVASQQQQKDEVATLMYLFFKPIVKDVVLQEELDAVFEQLQEEIHTIFDSTSIVDFCTANNIRLTAVYEEDEMMKPLITDNTHIIYL